MMSVYQYNAKTDANQAEIVAALRGVGAGVWYIRLPFDLLVGFRGTFFLLDCKVGKEEFNERQKLSLRVVEACGCKAWAVHDVDEALKAIGAIG